MPLPNLSISHDILCQSCGYNLRGLSTNRCPECGGIFDPEELPGADIPWLKRPAIGGWSAYWETVFLVMFNPLKLANQVWHSPRLDPRAAMRFRRIVIFQALASAVVVAASLICLDGRGRIMQDYKAIVAVVGVTAVIFFVFLHLATDVSVFLSPAPNSTGEVLWRRTLAHYACAPLAIAPLIGGITIVAAQFGGLLGFVWLTPLLVMLAWWWVANILIMHVINGSYLSSLWQAVMLPLTWIVSFIAALLLGLVTASLLSVVLTLFP